MLIYSINRIKKLLSIDKTVYKRKLPQNLVRMASNKGKDMLRQAMDTGYAQSFPNLIQQFITQKQPSTCGSATLALILNALQTDPGLKWKGIWRWYDDYNIRGITQNQLKQGISLQQWNNLAIINNIRSMHFYPETHSMNHSNINIATDQAIRDCIKACTRKSNLYLTTNFNRKILEQTGLGHFSPIAAYHETNDMVLMLDVAKFKYPLYWCPMHILLKALKPIDHITGLPRGFTIAKRLSKSQSLICDWQIDIPLLQHFKSQKSLNKINNFNSKTRCLLIPILFELCSLKDNNVILLQQIKHELNTNKKFKQYCQLHIEYNNEIKQLIRSFTKQEKYVFYLLHQTFHTQYNKLKNDKRNYNFIFISFIEEQHQIVR